MAIVSSSLDDGFSDNVRYVLTGHGFQIQSCGKTLQVPEEVMQDSTQSVQFCDETNKANLKTGLWLMTPSDIKTNDPYFAIEQTYGEKHPRLVITKA